MSRVQTVLVRALMTALGAGIALGVFSHDRSLVLRVWMLVLGGLALAALVGGAHDLVPRRAARRTRPKPARRRPDELRRLEDQTALACVAAGDLHRHLRPVLREIAAERLAGRELPAGSPAWELLRPDRPPPRDPFARGLSAAQLSEIVDQLEAL